ncbi:MAG: putative O-methyltransferase [halophilic archaeon J07HX5]|nr:MAG: putative O-methyltransferase [halophilic archaeon J07HX5]
MNEESVHPEATALAELVGPDHNPVQRRMAAHASEESFPIVGPTVGAWLLTLTRAIGAERVFEFGSGFGYSASWFLRGMGSDGEIVLTEIDADELALAEQYFATADDTDRVRFEHGDAIEIIETYAGPFDIVLLDNEKPRYREAFKTVEQKLRPGSLVVADNILAGPIDRGDVRALLDGASAPAASDPSRGIATYLRYVRDRPGETVLVPFGEGLSVTQVAD